jgi:hypothetical protein
MSMTLNEHDLASITEVLCAILDAGSQATAGIRTYIVSEIRMVVAAAMAGQVQPRDIGPRLAALRAEIDSCRMLQ